MTKYKLTQAFYENCEINGFEFVFDMNIFELAEIAKDKEKFKQILLENINIYFDNHHHDLDLDYDYNNTDEEAQTFIDLIEFKIDRMQP